VDRVPLGLLLLSPSAVIIAGILLPPPAAHWSDHLLSAAAAGGCVAAIAAGTYLVRKRLTLAPILILGGLTAGLGLEVIGNVVAARSIWRQPWGDEEVSDLAQSLQGFELGHDLAGWGDSLVVASGLGLAVYAGARRWVSTGPAFLGGVLAFFPPWVLPGVGAVFLLAWTAVQQRRSPAGIARPQTELGVVSDPSSAPRRTER
jgi:hypothetical protein